MPKRLKIFLIVLACLLLLPFILLTGTILAQEIAIAGFSLSNECDYFSKVWWPVKSGKGIEMTAKVQVDSIKNNKLVYSMGGKITEVSYNYEDPLEDKLAGVKVEVLARREPLAVFFTDNISFGKLEFKTPFVGGVRKAVQADFEKDFKEGDFVGFNWVDEKGTKEKYIDNEGKLKGEVERLRVYNLTKVSE